MFAHILVLMDGTASAEHALAHARALAGATHGTLHLVRVVDLPSAVKVQRVGAPVNVYSGVIDTQRDEASAYLEDARRRAEADGDTVVVQRLEGAAAKVLPEYVRTAHIDTVVLTAPGGTALTGRSPGALANRLVRTSGIPVLLVPPEPAGATGGSS